MIMNNELQIPFAQRDHTGEGFFVTFTGYPGNSYASVNTVMHPLGASLQPTGKYFIYLLHHSYGSCHFVMDTREGELWNSEDMPAYIEPGMMDQLLVAIKSKRAQNTGEPHELPGFIVPIVRNGMEGYASVNIVKEMDKNELMPTGIYFTYLLHPNKGSCHFTMQQDVAQIWFSPDAPSFVEEDIVLEIGTEIKFKMKK